MVKMHLVRVYNNRSSVAHLSECDGHDFSKKASLQITADATKVTCEDCLNAIRKITEEIYVSIKLAEKLNILTREMYEELWDKLEIEKVMDA